MPAGFVPVKVDIFDFQVPGCYLDLCMSTQSSQFTCVTLLKSNTVDQSASENNTNCDTNDKFFCLFLEKMQSDEEKDLIKQGRH